MPAPDHPCKGMTKAQIAAFEAIAINQTPRCKWDTIDALIKAGVVERGFSETKKDAMGIFYIPSFYVPTPIHMQWCDWCSGEQERLRVVGGTKPEWADGVAILRAVLGDR